MTRAFAASLLLFTLSPIGWAEDGEARRIVERVSETYASLTSFHFVLTITTEVLEEPFTGQRFASPVVVAVSEGGKVRAELNDPQTTLHTIFDGEITWIYVPRLNQYARPPLAEMPIGAGPTAIATDFATQYATLAERVDEAKLVGEETLEAGDCIVLEVTYLPDAEVRDAPEGAATLWVEKERHVVLKDSFMTRMPTAPGESVQAHRTMEVTEATVNEALPEALFTFTPPEGAREVDPRHLFEVRMVGQPASDFTLKDLDGEETQLESLRGKVVLLDFWATWCGPCRIELPYIQKLHEEFGDRVVFLGINDEPPATARSFLEQNNFTFRTLTDATREVADAYRIEGIPTVFVIDAEGRITEHYVGARSEEDLRAALAKAGIQ